MTRVLLVDDDDDLRVVIERYLQSLGHEVITGSNGEDALRAILADRPDAVIIDWMMPEVDGLAVCRIVRHASENVGVPVILMTGRNSTDDVHRVLASGADEWLVKPFSLDRLAAALDRVLDTSEHEPHRVAATR